MSKHEIIALLSIMILSSGCMCGSYEINPEDLMLKGDDDTDTTTEPTRVTAVEKTTLVVETTASLKTTTTSLVQTTTTSQPEVVEKDCSKVKPQDKLDCYTDNARYLQDISYCDRLTHTNEKVICKAVYKRDDEECKRITNSRGDTDVCIKKVAVEKRDKELCKKIRSPQTTTECIKSIT